MTLPSIPILAGTGATVGLFLGSHAFDWDYLLQCIWIELLGSNNVSKRILLTGEQQTKEEEEEQQQSTSDPSTFSYYSSCMAYRFLDWYKSSFQKVSSRDVDFNLHMNNARYSRHADLIRYRAIVEMSFVETLRKMDSSIVLVVSAMSQKFRREISWGQNYQLWIRIVGWEGRHLYIEHLFVIYPSNTQRSNKNVSQSTFLSTVSGEDKHRPKLDGSISSIHAYQNYQIQQLESFSDLMVASILLVRLTTTRTKQNNNSSSGNHSNTNIIRIVDILRKMGITDAHLPDVLQPPDDVMIWSQSLDNSSRRIIPSKL